jgi:NAD(P)-dependent dehydrogenase (short-subunit alcohol dehydrogenase family)
VQTSRQTYWARSRSFKLRSLCCARREAVILPVSSVAGLVNFPLGGIYQAPKFAVEGLAQTLAQEVAAFGIKVTLSEPGPFATYIMSESSMKHAAPMAEYEPLRQQLATMLTPEMFGEQRRPTRSSKPWTLPPLHLVLGPLLPMIRRRSGKRYRTPHRSSRTQ